MQYSAFVLALLSLATAAPVANSTVEITPIAPVGLVNASDISSVTAFNSSVILDLVAQANSTEIKTTPISETDLDAPQLDSLLDEIVRVAGLDGDYAGVMNGTANSNTTDATLSKRGNIRGSLGFYKSVQISFNSQLKNCGNSGAGVEATILAFIQHIDSHIDFIINCIGNFCAPFTFGLSKIVACILLNPICQAIIDGCEILCAKLIGGPIDICSQATLYTLQSCLDKLYDCSINYGIDSNTCYRLSCVQNKVSDCIAARN